jgi:hypothetical protein
MGVGRGEKRCGHLNAPRVVQKIADDLIGLDRTAFLEPACASRPPK